MNPRLNAISAFSKISHFSRKSREPSRGLFPDGNPCLSALLRKMHARANNTIDIDVVIVQGHGFLPAVDILKNWFEQYLRDLRRPNREVQSDTD